MRGCHSQDKFVRYLPNKSKHYRVRSSHCNLIAFWWERQKNPGGQKKEENNDIQSKNQIYPYIIYIYYIFIPQYSTFYRAIYQDL